MLKQVRDDIKSLINQIKKTDLRDQVAFNELCYGRRVGDRIYAFCPFCRKVVEIDAGLTEPQGGRLRLQETASCGCRQGLRYIQLGFLERMQPRKKDQKHPFDDIRFQIRIKGDLYKRTLRIQLAQEQRKQEQKQKQQTPDERSWEVGLHGAAFVGADYGTDYGTDNSGRVAFTFRVLLRMRAVVLAGQFLNFVVMPVMERAGFCCRGGERTNPQAHNTDEGNGRLFYIFLTEHLTHLLYKSYVSC